MYALKVSKVFQTLFTTLYNYSSVLKPSPEFLFCEWLMFFSAGLSCARINLLQAASGMVLQNHRRLPVSIFSVKVAALGSLKRVTGRIFKISKSFQRSKLKLLTLIFSSTKKQKIVKIISACTESIYLLL